ncbi:MAG: uroporphyrinogen decarboxylase family protein [Anaerolineae bacterium]
MPTSRDRVIAAIDFEITDRVPRDLGGMRSTGISAFAYPKLVAALGLPPRRPKVEDTWQMLALPDRDVLDALGCDVVTIADGATNAFDQPDLWRDYDFNGRLPAQVRNPDLFEAQPDGTIVSGNRRMVPDSYVFDDPHGGQPLDLSAELPKPDLREFEQHLAGHELTDEEIRAESELCHRVRESTDRAVFYNKGAISSPIGIGNFVGLAIFPMLCLLEPDYVRDLHEIATQHTLKNLRALLPEIRDDVDVLMLAADDWGTQSNLIASPQVYRDLFLPYRQRINAAVRELAPNAKRFLHSCGAIYKLIDLVIESDFDVLNPVQWSAGDASYRAWKERAQAGGEGRVALWGGGVNSQVTLPLGSVEDVAEEVRQVVATMAEGGGYVFCNIHNILAEIAPEKVIAMYEAAGEVRVT